MHKYISRTALWNMGGNRLENNGDDVAFGKDAKTNLFQSVSGNVSSIYAWLRQEPKENKFISSWLEWVVDS